MFRTLFGAATLSLLAVSASSATFEFNYQIASTNQELTGFFVAEENAPGLLDVTDAFGLALDGVALPDVVRVSRVSDVRETFGQASTDAQFLDATACFDAGCNRGIGFWDSPPFDLFYLAIEGEPTIFDDPINSGGFSLLPVNTDPPSGGGGGGTPSPAPVPLPASAALLLAGLGGLAVMRRKR